MGKMHEQGLQQMEPKEPIEWYTQKPPGKPILQSMQATCASFWQGTGWTVVWGVYCTIQQRDPHTSCTS